MVLSYIKKYPLLYKNKKVAYIAIPFTFDTETSHTPINKKQQKDNLPESWQNPLIEAVKDVKVSLPKEARKNIDLPAIKKVFNFFHLFVDPSGVPFDSYYDEIKNICSLPDFINIYDQINYIYEALNLIYQQKHVNNIDETSILDGVHTWVYQWALCFRAGEHFSDVVTGRTARELVSTFKELESFLINYSAEISRQKLEDKYKNVSKFSRYNLENPSKTALKECETKVKCVIYAHNLGYDYEYIYQLLEDYFDSGDDFYIKPHKPLTVKLGDYIELRDSLLYFNDNLERITNKYNVTHKKLVGAVDYSAIHYPDERLTLKDWEYQLYDVLGLQEAIIKDWELSGYDIISAPLTSTGKVRKAFQGKYLEDPENRKLFTSCHYSEHVYKFLRLAFMGGYTHGNRNYKGVIIDDDILKRNKCDRICHRDLRSAHPSELRKPQNLYQAGQFDELEKPTLEDMRKPGTVSVGLFMFKDAVLKNKNDGFPFLSTSRALQGAQNKLSYISDNGRALKIKGIFVLYLTNVDFEILYEQYNFSEVEIVCLFRSIAKPLPEWFISFLDYKYHQKTYYKRLVKEAEKSGDIDALFTANINLLKAKNEFNGIYGMCAQDICKPDISRNESEYEYTPKDIQKTLDNYFGLHKGSFNKTSKGFLPYSWGVFDIAYERRRIYNELKIVNVGNRGLYCDTDSIFYMSNDDLEYYFDAENQKCYDEAIKGGYYIEDNGTITTYDSFDSENDIKRFKFLHSKCYAFDDLEDKLNVVIAGIPARCIDSIDDKGNIKYFYREEELKSLENLNDYFTFKKCGGNTIFYKYEEFTSREVNGHFLECGAGGIVTPIEKQIKDTQLKVFEAEKDALNGIGEI